MDKLMYNFLLCQKKTDDKSLVLPEDINRLICQNIADFVKHEHRKADMIEMKNYMPNHKWLKDGVLHRDCDLPAFIVILDSMLYDENDKYESWWQNGKLSRLNKPACIIYTSFNTNIYIYAFNGIVSKIELNIEKINNNDIITQIIINNYSKIIDSIDKYDIMINFILMLLDSC